jgi:hypothetical protein
MVRVQDIKSLFGIVPTLPGTALLQNFGWMELALSEVGSVSMGCLAGRVPHYLARRVPPTPEKRILRVYCHHCPWLAGPACHTFLALSLFAESPLELLTSFKLYPSPLSSFSYRWARPPLFLLHPFEFTATAEGRSRHGSQPAAGLARPASSSPVSLGGS